MSQALTWPKPPAEGLKPAQRWQALSGDTIAQLKGRRDALCFREGPGGHTPGFLSPRSAYLNAGTSGFSRCRSELESLNWK